VEAPLPLGALASRLLVLAAILPLLACSEPTERPNLVLIIGDDQGWSDFGFMGSPLVRTPSLDRLAAEGTVFTHGFNTASICRPSLRSLLTGLHPHQWHTRLVRLREAGPLRADPDRIRDFVTLPRLLGERGYASFEGGKFWESDHVIAGFTHGMQKPGDDPAHGGVGRYIGREPMTPLHDFIGEHREKPFFIWFAPQLPHYPHDPPPRYQEAYQDLELTPSALLYYANITRLDEVVGELLAHLEEAGLRDRTLVVFLSDNGWDQQPDYLRSGIPDGPRGKKTVYELGIRTPIVFSWPGVIPEGVRRDELVSTVDLFPTLLDYAGVPTPASRPGHSLQPLLEGSDEWTREVVIGRTFQVRLPPELRAADPTGPALSRSASFLRTAAWRCVWYEDLDRVELYDVEADPRETRNLAASQPQLVARFREQILQWREEMERLLAAAPDPREAERP
jgi:uncharacterized sulfatase